MKANIINFLGRFWISKKFQNSESSVEEIKASQKKKKLRTKPSLIGQYICKQAEFPQMSILVFDLLMSLFVLIVLGVIGVVVFIYTGNRFLLYVVLVMSGYSILVHLYNIYLIIRATWTQMGYNTEMSLYFRKLQKSDSVSLFKLGFQHYENEKRIILADSDIGNGQLSFLDQSAFWSGQAFCHGQEDEISGKPEEEQLFWRHSNYYAYQWYLRGREAAYE